MADTFVSAIIFRAAPKARNRQKQCSMIFLLCEICFAQEMRACARVKWSFGRNAVSVSLRDGSKIRDSVVSCCRASLRDAIPQTLRLPRPRCGLAMTQNRYGLIWKTDVFHFCGYFLRGVAPHRFSNVSFRKLFRFPSKPIRFVIARRAHFAPDAAIFNEAIFIMFLPHLGACFARLPCRSSVFSKK